MKVTNVLRIKCKAHIIVDTPAFFCLGMNLTGDFVLVADSNKSILAVAPLVFLIFKPFQLKVYRAK